jgi:hypothetical protein
LPYLDPQIKFLLARELRGLARELRGLARELRGLQQEGEELGPIHRGLELRGLARELRGLGPMQT